MRPIHFDQTKNVAAIILAFLGFAVAIVGMTWYLSRLQ
jgi:hypothetical protein